MTKSRWLLLGGDALAGKDVRDLVAERKLPVVLRLASGEPADAVLTEEEGELAVMEPLDAELLSDADVVLLAASAEIGKKALALAHGLKLQPAFVDMLGHFEDLPQSVLRAPLLESVAPAHDGASIHSLAHPAAVALVRLLMVLHETSPVRGAVITILEPVSQQGKPGIDELHKQTISLFSFHKQPQEVFDTQVSFNLLPRYGDDARVSLERSENRIERDLASLLGPRGLPLPSIRVVHAPVFHGYCMNVWVDFERRPSREDVSAALDKAEMDVRGPDVEPGSNVSVAGQSGLVVSDITEDRASTGGMWMWLAFDNLRTLAENALLTAALLAKEKQSK